MNGSRPHVFFDLAGTLGAERTSHDGKRLARFEAFPGVASLIRELRDEVRFGVLSFDPELEPGQIWEALQGTAAKLGEFFDPELVLVPPPGGLPEILPDADLSVFVGLHAVDRMRALEAGLRVAPHPVLLPNALAEDEPWYVRLSTPGGGPTFPWDRVLSGRPIASLHAGVEDAPVLYALAPRSELDRLSRAVQVTRLGDDRDAAQSSLHLLQVRREDLERSEKGSGFLESLRDELSFVWESPNGLIVPIPGDRSVDRYHPPRAAHGHTVEFVPSALPLNAPPAADPLSSRPLSQAEVAAMASLDGASLGGFLDQLTGAAAVDTPQVTGLNLVSRHTDHDHNADAADWLGLALAQSCGSQNSWKYPVGKSSAGETRFNVVAEIPGSSPNSGMVVVGAHLDSTAAEDSGYQPVIDAAPGADDDASGVAGVLAAAEVLAALSQVATPERTIRFVLFNREEQGRHGSIAYAEALHQYAVPVAAMIQMDMIGWTLAGASQPRFEVHGSGVLDFPKVHESSTQLVAVVVDAAGQVSPALSPEVYPLAGPPPCPRDPAALRSDHSSFHAQDFPACLVCEDLFNDSCASPSQTGNPLYHSSGDDSVALDYAAGVSRAVAAAAWMIATPAAPAPVLTPPPDLNSSSGPPSDSPSVTPNLVSDGSLASTADDSLPFVPQPSGGNGPMPNKYIVEFLAKWIRDEDFRCKVLHQEITTLEDEGYTAQQIDVLTSLDKTKIIAELVKELEQDLGIKLDILKGEVWGVLDQLRLPGDNILVNPDNPTETIVTPSFTPAPEVLAEAGRGRRMVTANFMMAAVTLAQNMLYAQGKVHLRNTDPAAVSVDEKRIITIRGQGFEPGKTPDVRFTYTDPDTGIAKQIDGDVKGVTCDIDIYQRVEVKVELDTKGTWAITARNPGGAWSESISIAVT